MKLPDFIAKLAKKAKVDKDVVRSILEAQEAVVTKALTGGDKIVLPGFVTFEARPIKKRKSRNPRTGEEIIVPAHNRAVIKAGSRLKAAVKGD